MAGTRSLNDVSKVLSLSLFLSIFASVPYPHRLSKHAEKTHIGSLDLVTVSYLVIPVKKKDFLVPSKSKGPVMALTGPD